MAEPVRHRQTKGAATDMFDLQPPRHISTLRVPPVAVHPGEGPLPNPQRALRLIVGNWSSCPRPCENVSAGHRCARLIQALHHGRIKDSSRPLLRFHYCVATVAPGVHFTERYKNESSHSLAP